jgi:hypothetical protein
LKETNPRLEKRGFVRILKRRQRRFFITGVPDFFQTQFYAGDLVKE